VLDTQLCLEQPERDWQRCTLDGLVGEGGAVYAAADDGDALGAATGILEVKNSGAFGWDEIPDEYQAQCQWNMGIAGKPQAWLAVLHAGRRLRIYELPFDPEAFEIFTDIARRFWHDHVLARNPPPVDSSDATAEALKAAYRDRADDTAIVFDAELRDLAVEWRHARRVCEEAEARKTLAESRLRQALGESTAGMFDGEPLVTWKPQRRAGRIREADLRAAHPDLARQFSEPDGVTRVLRATKTLKTLAGED
jgi:predicted phage-related endonuclease